MLCRCSKRRRRWWGPGLRSRSSGPCPRVGAIRHLRAPSDRRRRRRRRLASRSAVRDRGLVAVAESVPISGGGAIWATGPDGVQRIDPATGSSSTDRRRARQPVSVREWTGLAAGTRSRSPLLHRSRIGLPDYSPYLVSAIDPATREVVSVTELPGTCRYAADNRNRRRSRLREAGRSRSTSPACATCSVDASTGQIGSTISMEDGVVIGSDARGALAARPGGSCSAQVPSRLDRIDDAGTVVAPDVLPVAGPTSWSGAG